jgi:hypothetical protein
MAHPYVYMPLKQTYPRVYTHRLHFGPRVAHCPEATHVCIVRVPVPPPHTHVPAPPHTLTSPTSHVSCLMYRAAAVASLKRQAWGIRQASYALSSRTPHLMYRSHPMMLPCRRRPLDTGRSPSIRSLVCRTMVHSARTPTTRPLPRPAAIASRHATSQAMQAAHTCLAGIAGCSCRPLFTTQPMPLSRLLMQAHMQSPNTAREP